MVSMVPVTNEAAGDKSQMIPSAISSFIACHDRVDPFDGIVLEGAASAADMFHPNVFPPARIGKP